METKHDKHGGNAFLWGLIIGALFATLLTTKRGRQILRELTNLGLELFEDFVEERTNKNQEARSMNQEEGAEEVTEDLESEITETEIPVESASDESVSPAPKNGNGNGHSPKKRLFRGIRRPK